MMSDLPPRACFMPERSGPCCAEKTAVLHDRSTAWVGAIRVVGCLLLACGAVWAADAPASRPSQPTWDRLLVASYSGDVQIVGRDGAILWSAGVNLAICDAAMLPDGTIVYSHTNGATLVRPDLKSGKGAEVLWKHKTPAGGETHSCQPLGDGRFLIGESFEGVSHIIEEDTSGKEHARIELKNRGGKHSTFRVIRKTPQGTYLVSAQDKDYKGRRAMEVDSKGGIVRMYPGGGFMAERLPNGNTLMSAGDEMTGAGDVRIHEADPEGRIVWQLKRDELPEVTIGYAAGVCRLPNGNTLICNWGGHKNASGPSVFEVTAEKRIVWQTTEGMLKRVTCAVPLPPADHTTPGEVPRTDKK